MAEIKVPEEIANWISLRNWGDHHDEWHTVRRWDVYHRLADLARNGDNRFEWAIDIVDYISERGWQRAQFQEGETGNGIDFLGMHRAMLLLLVESFPQHAEIFSGWTTPPTDPNDTIDPVSDRSPFDVNMLNAIDRIENQLDSFASEEEFGLYLETSMRPTSSNPFGRSSDPSTGLHNYLHGRWTDNTSDINLGDPTVNIYNTRFWKLHGWVDKSWSKFRAHHNLSDDNQQYIDTINHYKMMMNMTHHMHEIIMISENKMLSTLSKRPSGLNKAFIDDFGV